LLRSPPRTEGPRIVANHVHSKARSRSRAAYGFAPSAPPFGGLPRGEFPGRFRGFWLAAPLLDLRWVEHRDPRGPYDRGAPHAKACARNPPDLDADFPVASRSMRSDLLVELPLLGLSKDRPSIVPIEESDSRRRAAPRAGFDAGVARPGLRAPPFDGGAAPGASFEMRTPVPIRVPPAWFFTTSTVWSSSTTRPYCRPLPILGFTAFPPVAKQDFPLCTCCPSKPSLRRQRRLPERILAAVGSRHRLDRLRPLRSPRTLPSRPFSLTLIPPRFPAASSR
jgi:hypothetical protein